MEQYCADPMDNTSAMRVMRAVYELMAANQIRQQTPPWLWQRGVRQRIKFGRDVLQDLVQLVLAPPGLLGIRLNVFVRDLVGRGQADIALAGKEPRDYDRRHAGLFGDLIDRLAALPNCDS